MSHWAELDENNIVIRVVVGDNNDPNEDEGYQWLIDNLGGTWVKTSYNAYHGKRRDPITNQITDEIGFRKNFAGIGYFYDENIDAFIPPKPAANPSFILDEQTGTWKAPVEKPLTGNYYWDEESISWKESNFDPTNTITS